ncbi:hypothetical protein L1281_001433 [Neisseria sp. HSC-16F19]|nr:hypothetical protein [Neisseria sp. HSC-16F19]MCP2040843.1 hypothetical protein [Neisseria sp. HSC-16F19]
MDNYYAWLGTHVLADEAQLKRALLRQSEAGRLSLEQIRTLQQVLFHPQRKSVYDHALRQAHPELWTQAEQVLQAADTPFETANEILHPASDEPWWQRKWVWALTLIVLLLGTWQIFSGSTGNSREFADHLPDTNLHPTFIEALSHRASPPHVGSFHPGNGLLLNSRLQAVYNGNPAQEPYRTALEHIRRHYHNRPVAESRANNQVLWLAEDRLLLGHDVWQLGTQGATKVSRLSMPEQSETHKQLADILANRLDRFMTAVPTRDYVARAYPIRGIMQLEFFHTQSGQFLSIPDGTLEEANDFDLMVLAPPYLHFSSDGRYMLLSYAVRDKVWEIKYNQDGQIQNIQPLGHINVRTKATKLDELKGPVTMSPSRAVWMGSQTVRTVDADGTLQTWSLPRLRQLHTEKLPIKVFDGQFSADGRHLWLESISTDTKRTYHYYSVADNKLSLLDVPASANPEQYYSFSHLLGHRHIWLYHPRNPGKLLSAPE